MFSHNDFSKYALRHRGISSLTMHRYQKLVSGYISPPTIIEERQLNVAQMDVFQGL